MGDFKLSKSRILAGIQCHKRIYLTCHSPDKADPISPGVQFRFDEGTRVGSLARELFSGGLLINVEHDAVIDVTKKALEDPKINYIYEAAFVYESIVVRVDVLSRCEENTWDIIEVKSSTKPQNEHVQDLAIQKIVLCGNSLKIKRTKLLYLNNKYIFNGLKIDMGELFVTADLTNEVAGVEEEILGRIADIRKVLSAPSTPEIKIGKQCDKPHKCNFHKHCHSGLEKNHVTTLPRVTTSLLNRLYDQNIESITKIPDDFYALSKSQKIVRDCVAENKTYIDRQELKKLENLTTPICFLDFETINPAIPIYKNTAPYERIPFQWSLHIFDGPSDPLHKEFLADSHADPRIGFLDSLLSDLPTSGSIVVYSSAEKTVLNHLKLTYPEMGIQLESVVDRLFDLLPILTKGYYHPLFGGSSSLKRVLPALIPELSYDRLEIGGGMDASAMFMKMALNDLDPLDFRPIREKLLQYCKLDTRALFLVYKVLVDELRISKR